MPKTVKALAAASSTSGFETATIERRDLDDNDVRIEIKYAGICHSDVHTTRDEWAGTAYPLTPGHEIAGIVTEVGSGATKYKVGDHVGVGCFVDSCNNCENCASGDDNYCLNGNTGTYNAVDKYGKQTAGGYSQEIVVDENYVLSIPESMPLDAAAPLLCAGITLYSPLNRWNAGPGKKVAIIGLGGLGHMGVKIASAMGAEVTVLSQSLKKMEDGLRMGASHYYATDNPETFDKLANTFDLIVNTVAVQMDMTPYINMLRLHGTIVQVGLPEGGLDAPIAPLFANQRSYGGSGIGSIKETQEMLDFCAQHDLTAEIEVIPASAVNEAYDRVVNSDVRYRFVIDNATL